MAWQDLSASFFIILHFINLQNKERIFIWLLYEYLKLRYSVLHTPHFSLQSFKQLF